MFQKICVSLLISLILVYGAPNREIVHDICMLESDVDLDKIIFNNGELPADQELQNYLKCVYLNLRYIEQDGTILLENLIHSDYMLENTAEKIRCLEKLEKKEILEDINTFVECIYW